MVRVCCVVCDARSVQKCACVAVRLAWCGSAAPIARAQAHVFPNNTLSLFDKWHLKSSEVDVGLNIYLCSQSPDIHARAHAHTRTRRRHDVLSQRRRREGAVAQ